jgi:hypothetical protein
MGYPTASRGQNAGTEFAVVGILNLGAVPPEQQRLPLSEVEPLPLVPFRWGLGETSALPRQKARPAPANAQRKPAKKSKRKRKR